MGQMLGVMPTREAQRLADAQGLDLVEVSPNAEPPVCKIMDYGKFRYEESIKRKEARKHQKVVQIKEVKFHATTDTGDIDHKLRQIREFIEEGDKVKVTLQYRGRENAHKELGFELVNKVVEACSAFAITEQAPKLIGRVLGCLLAPKPVKAGSSGSQQAKAPKTEQQQQQPQQPQPKVAPKSQKDDFDPLRI
jgi:translation initiation factor IF-3